MISRSHILTAAHCVTKYKSTPKFVSAVLGKNLFADNGVIVAKIGKIVVHSSYVEEFLHDDIALLKTVNEIEFSTAVQLIALPQSNVDLDGGQRAVACGFGAINNVS